MQSGPEEAERGRIQSSGGRVCLRLWGEEGQEIAPVPCGRRGGITVAGQRWWCKKVAHYSLPSSPPRVYSETVEGSGKEKTWLLW